MGIINVGGEGTVTADDGTFEIGKLSAVYLGKGTKMFHSAPNQPTIQPYFTYYLVQPTLLIPM